MRQNPPVVPYAHLTISEQKISLGIDIYQNPFTPCSNQLKDHFLYFLLPGQKL
jgi:hypothetical protein